MEVLKKIDRLDDKLGTIAECQIRMESDLKYHIKRTDILEEKVEPIVKAHNAIKWVGGALGCILLFKEQILKLLGVS